MKTWPVPSSVKEVQQFLRLANYYRRFIRDFASIAKPLHKLTEKNSSFLWTKECQQSFETLREQLSSSPVLCYPNLRSHFFWTQIPVMMELELSCPSVMLREKNKKGIISCGYFFVSFSPLFIRSELHSQNSSWSNRLATKFRFYHSSS